MKRHLLLFLIALYSYAHSHAQDFGQKPFSNPAFMLGTDLGRHLQTLYKLNRIDDMVAFTSSETIGKYGIRKVRSYYEGCGLGYDIKLASMTSDGKYKTLTYNAKINATNNVLRMKAVVENDTAKVVLDDLRIFHGQ